MGAWPDGEPPAEVPLPPLGVGSDDGACEPGPDPGPDEELGGGERLVPPAASGIAGSRGGADIEGWMRQLDEPAGKS